MTSKVLTLRLFGEWEARSDNQPLTGLHLREGERLLAYLTLRHSVPVTYRQIAQQFWPAEAHQNAQYDSGDYPSTRQAIATLRRALGDHAERLASVSKGVVRLDLAGADVDMLCFETLVQQNDADAWRQALALYRAPLLADWPEKWIGEHRTRCERSCERISAYLAAHAAAAAPISALPASVIFAPVTAPPAPPSVFTASPALPANACSDDCANVPASVFGEGMRESDGGAVPLNSPLYVERPADLAFRQALGRGDSIVLVKGARQVGKTSLLARSLQAARQAGACVVLTDFQKFNTAQFASVDALYLALASAITLQLDLDVSPHKVWDADFGPNMNLEWFLRRHVLKAISGPLVWGMDEVDRLFGCAFGSEVFGLFRSWHNERSLAPSSPWARMTLAIAYATEAHLFITDLNQSPFNVGTRLTLDDFTPAQIEDLSGKYGCPLKNRDEAARLWALVGGQPYLARRGLDALAGGRVSLKQMEAEGDADEGPFGDHLRQVATALARSPDLSDVVRGMLAGQPCPVGEPFYRLRAGVLAGLSSQEARFRCPLYASYLARHLR